MKVLLSECWTVYRYGMVKVLVCVSVWNAHCLPITSEFLTLQVSVSWVVFFKGSILFKNPGFVWHLVLILLVYISSLPNFCSNISCYFSPSSFFPSYFFIWNVPSTIPLLSLTENPVSSRPHLCIQPSTVSLMRQASEGPCYITAPLWFSVLWGVSLLTSPPAVGKLMVASTHTLFFSYPGEHM